MRTVFTIPVGNSEKPNGFLKKTVHDLPWTPFVGMTYSDGTLKGGMGRVVQRVTLFHIPERAPNADEPYYLEVDLAQVENPDVELYARYGWLPYLT